MLLNIRGKIKSNKGFTLIELMVVVAIIGLLVAIAIPKFSDASAAARGAKIAADLRTIDSAIQLAIANGGTVAANADYATQTAVTANLASAVTPPVGSYKGPQGSTGTVAASTTYAIIASGSSFRAALGTTLVENL
ncbi:competence type IV pilus major pilin ComGC [Anaeroselena agilis]|uniref:Prepilin-type N-terminal cleavage/methylation domain-containing protein n=1 Tax=Anaeroselena agilis TaxID=3063788 RepID=A0ABU3NYC9_9FIRM|nr:prepilin-type N-terminal cleavage/methylation domain-containing protein [Selenomonadales bacterium 4137-cl]